MSALFQMLMKTTSFARFVFTQTISTNTSNYNLRSAAIAAGWDQTLQLIATVTINSGVYISASSTANPAFDTGTSFPLGSTLTLINNGFIIGMGGAGGSSPNSNNPGNPGGAGGLALRAQHPISITNSGTIGGGGGGGGGGAGNSTDGVPDQGGGGGGGRSGNHNSAGGALNGQQGTVSAPGNGGNGPSGNAGGAGGGWGAAGNNGSGITPPGGAGGSAGGAVNGNTNITWVATGTRLGAIT